jgi:DNA-binding response OmpR family regulator
MNRRLPRVLVADNDVANRKSLTWHLQDAGFHVVPAACGSDVLLQCEIEPPDAIIMDVGLPDMDGYDVCAHLRRDARSSEVDIILMSEAADDMSRAYLAKMVDYAGGDYFLAKPCDVNLLVKLIDDIVRSAGDLRSGHNPANDLCSACSPTHVVWPTTRMRNVSLSF